MRSARTSVLAVVVAVLLGLTACSGDDSGGGGAAAGSTAPGTLAPATETASPSPATPTATTPAAATSPASRQAPGKPSSIVRVCGTQEADTKARDCDQMQRTFSSSTVYCSADLPSSVDGEVAVSLLRNGAPVYSAQASRVDSSQTLFLSFSVGRLQLPGGTYACEFKKGADTWTGSAQVTGPTGLANQTMACDGSTMVRTGGIAHCPKAVTTLAAPRSIGCSSVITDVQGKQVDVLVSTPAGERRASAGKQANGIAVLQLAADAQQLGGRITPGRYGCTFLVDGKRVSETAVTVTA
ncbi:hypothetical protein PZ938_19870 [Luteipulveratus sp. YIM 133132]|uniref:hypothetical protein n=1 Tax=Luteipulveratus flavus TaxID=3031728 RepID=UPI0023AEACD7|nr:hypothetical protein [Luteipulveratus sp. YIM 133132]MDE9367881.1 hypothetical protein [Luteipulveratus sp. YIM 133132]